MSRSHEAGRDDELTRRAARHAALADPVRLQIVDALVCCDRAPVELRRALGIESNLLAHHLDVLENVGMIERTRSHGDGRRRYVRLRKDALGGPLGAEPAATTATCCGPALFICSANSARSQLAAALWQQRTGQPGLSAGTHPAERVHPGAVAAARRAGLELREAKPRALDDLDDLPPLVVTVCDEAHEEVGADASWLHWSIADPVPSGRARDFDAALVQLRERVDALACLPAAP